MAIQKKKPEYKPPIEKKLMNFFLDILKYPKKVINRYSAYNAGVSEIAKELKDMSLDQLRIKNGKLVHLFIWFPTALGIIVMIVMMLINRKDFIVYYNTVFSALKYLSIFEMVGAAFKRVWYIIAEFPLGLKVLKWIIYGYMGSIFGAWIMSKNPAFKEEERISHVFSTLGMIDSEGHPWKVTWTPNAIMVVAFNCDADYLVTNNKFWSSIHFMPSRPKINKQMPNKFIVVRKYELPEQLVFEFKE